MTTPVPPTQVEELLGRLPVGERNVLSLSKSLGELAGQTLVVERRAILPEAPRDPARAPSPRVAHTFHSAGALAAYLGRYGCARTVVFADLPAKKVHAVLDEQAPRGFEVVVLEPRVHPLWAPWKAILGTKIEIREFASFLLQNRRAVKGGGRALALLFAQVHASVSVDIHRSKPRPGVAALNGVTITTKIQGQDQKDTFELPELVALEVPLYVQTAPVSLEIDLTLEASEDGEVNVIASAGTVAEAEVAAFEDMAATIRVQVAQLGASDGESPPPGGVFVWGAPAHAPWATLPEIPAKG